MHCANKKICAAVNHPRAGLASCAHLHLGQAPDRFVIRHELVRITFHDLGCKQISDNSAGSWDPLFDVPGAREYAPASVGLFLTDTAIELP